MLTEKEERPVSILEIVEVQRYVQKHMPHFRNTGRKSLDWHALFCTFVTTCNNQRFAPCPLITSAFSHDRQTAIPLIKITSRKETHLYHLTDALYDIERIKEITLGSYQVLTIDKNGHGKKVLPVARHGAERYKIHSIAERGKSQLKKMLALTMSCSKDLRKFLCS